MMLYTAYKVTSRRDVRVEIIAPLRHDLHPNGHISQRCESRNQDVETEWQIETRHISQRCESRNFKPFAKEQGQEVTSRRDVRVEID